MKNRHDNTMPAVTVAVSAFNEAHNIGAWLQSVLSQREAGFRLERILVVSDGSVDATADIARTFGGKVEVLEFNDRSGKSSRLNQIYALLKSDILVQSDADVVFAHSYVIRDLIQPLLNEPAVAMCGGNPLPVDAQTFIEKAVNRTCAAYVPLRWQVRGGNNIFSADGRLLAYRRSFVKGIHVPHDMIANDAYTYFCCITQGRHYRFVRSAVVRFRSPQTVTEQMRQNTRFAAASRRMRRYFSADVVRQEYRIPTVLFAAHMARQFVQHPVACLFIFAINCYCKLWAIVVEQTLTAQWRMALTTKYLGS